MQITGLLRGSQLFVKSLLVPTARVYTCTLTKIRLLDNGTENQRHRQQVVYHVKYAANNYIQRWQVGALLNYSDHQIVTHDFARRSSSFLSAKYGFA